jgi:hypothetical protein
MPATRSPSQSWYASLSIDLFLRVLNNSIFHPFVASLIPLCLRAGEVPYSAPVFKNTVCWAIFVCIVHILLPINERIAYGKPRELDDEEVVVITGGACGLGKCIAELYALKGGTVAVIDVEAEDRIEGVNYYTCDVGDAGAVNSVWERITKEVWATSLLWIRKGSSDKVCT